MISAKFNSNILQVYIILKTHLKDSTLLWFCIDYFQFGLLSILLFARLDLKTLETAIIIWSLCNLVCLTLRILNKTV